MTTTATPTGFEALTAVHPHHAERIREHNAALLSGAIVTIDLVRDAEGRTLTNTGTFFTGVKPGDVVAISARSEYREHARHSVQILDGNAAHLSVNDSMSLTAVDPATWTREQALAAQQAAERAAADEMEQALAHGTGWGRYGAVTQEGEERAMQSLRNANALRHYAFACGVLGKYLHEVERAARDDKYAAVLTSRVASGVTL